MREAINIVPLNSDLVPAMLAASAADGGHCAPLATHCFVRGSEIVGAASLCAPVLNFWAHTSKLHRRDSLDLAKRCTARAAELHPSYLATCSPDSPFFALMPRLGFRRIGSADFFELAK